LYCRCGCTAVLQILTILVGFIPIIPPVRLVDPLPPVGGGARGGGGGGGAVGGDAERGGGRGRRSREGGGGGRLGRRHRWHGGTVPVEPVLAVELGRVGQVTGTDAAVEPIKPTGNLLPAWPSGFTVQPCPPWPFGGRFYGFNVGWIAERAGRVEIHFGRSNCKWPGLASLMPSIRWNASVVHSVNQACKGRGKRVGWPCMTHTHTITAGCSRFRRHRRLLLWRRRFALPRHAGAGLSIRCGGDSLDPRREYAPRKPLHSLCPRERKTENWSMRRTLETLAALALWLALCSLLAVVALGFVGFFD